MSNTSLVLRKLSVLKLADLIYKGVFEQKAICEYSKYHLFSSNMAIPKSLRNSYIGLEAGLCFMGQGPSGLAFVTQKSVPASGVGAAVLPFTVSKALEGGHLTSEEAGFG